MAQKLRKRRFDNGSINFDRHEVKFDIDESGKPIGVYFKVSKEANKLIEEFMLLANKKVAERIGKPKSGKKAPTFVGAFFWCARRDLNYVLQVLRTFLCEKQ